MAAAARDADAARAAARAREELIAVAAHGLRSPLQTISIGASLLGRSKEATHQANARRMSAAASSMSRLVEDMLASNAVESPNTQRRLNFKVAELLADAIDALGMVAARAEIALRLGPACDAALFADPAQLLRAVGNVVSNALKYWPPENSVELSARREGSEAVVSIADDGPGMGAADLARAFVRGWQGSNATARGDGAGLGLSIVRSLAEQNGGRVDIASSSGAGVRVEITLPIAGDASPGNTRPSRSPV